MSKNDVSLKDIYNLVDAVRRELMTSIQNLDHKFMLLEEGRVSSLEKEVAELKASHKPIRMLVYGLVGLILTAVIGALLGLVLIK